MDPQVVFREWMQIAVPPRVEIVADAVELLRRHLRNRGASEEAIDAVRLAVTEALTNAIAHGTGAEVRLDWCWHEERLDLRVSEPGYFEAPPDWHELPTDALEESGRGGFLITQLMDGVVHTNTNGIHTLHMNKRLGRASATPAGMDELEQTLGAMTEDLSASYEVLSALFRLAEALATSEDLSVFAAHALELRSLIDADAMHVRLLDAEGNLARLATAGGAAGPTDLPLNGSTLEAEVARTAQERTIEQRDALTLADPLHGTRGSAFVCPVIFQGRTRGVCAIVRHQDGPFFTAGQLSLTRTMSEFLGIACANAENQAQRRLQLQAQRELEIAAQIQQSLLPTDFPARHDWRLHGCCVNAQEVGGDFFDVIEVPRGVLLVIADVMGKGVPAALLALALRTAVRSQTQLAATPGHLLTAINAQLSPDLERLGMFITAQVVFLEAGTPRLVYANAGHCPLLVLPGAPGEPEELPGGGTPLGIVSTETFDDYSRELSRGQRVLLLTDGIIETAGADGQLLGPEGAGRLTMRCADLPVADACRGLLTAVDVFGGKRAASDDRTVLLVEAAG